MIEQAALTCKQSTFMSIVRFYVMKRFWIIFGLLVALVAGWFLGLPVYRGWKEKRFVAAAQVFYDRANFTNTAYYSNAVLSARQALVLNPANAEAWRVRARIAENIHGRGAIDLWQRVISLQPNTTNRLDFARCALLLGLYPRATEALRAIPEADRDTATYHQLAAMLAMSENNIAKAEWHFSRALELNPTNQSVRFDQAVLLLHAKKPDAVASAKKTLEALSTDPSLRKDALRHLAIAAVKDREFTRAEEFAKQLDSADAAFDDRILHLVILKESGSPEFVAQLENLKTAAANNPDDVHTLAGWLTDHGMSDAALQWLVSLPAAAQSQLAVRMARADTLMAQRDWKGLEAYLADQNWKEVDFVRLAQLARCANASKQRFQFESRWQDAVRSAGDRLKAMTFLARVASSWQWDEQSEDLLWAIIQRYPGERWALQALNQIYTATGNTHGLQKVFNKLVEFDNSDIPAKNNLAFVNLLLNTQTTQAENMAREAATKYPKNAGFVSTYAYALHLHGQTADGLKLFATLTPEQLEQPSIALYYGVLLTATGEKTKAAKYLDLAVTAPLLPEENKLLEAARGN